MFQYEILLEDEIVYASHDREEALEALSEESYYNKEKIGLMAFRISKNEEEVLLIEAEDILDYLEEDD